MLLILARSACAAWSAMLYQARERLHCGLSTKPEGQGFYLAGQLLIHQVREHRARSAWLLLRAAAAVALEL